MVRWNTQRSEVTVTNIDRFRRPYSVYKQEGWYNFGGSVPVFPWSGRYIVQEPDQKQSYESRLSVLGRRGPFSQSQ